MSKKLKKQSFWVVQKLVSRTSAIESQNAVEMWQTISKPLVYEDATKRLRTKNPCGEYRLLSGVELAMKFRSCTEESVNL